MAILNPTPEKLTQLRERVTRDCENCQGNPNWSVFAPSTCPDCMYGNDGCIMLTNFGRRCGKCNWCHNHPEEGGLDFYEDIK
jgi:hypothetical protein